MKKLLLLAAMAAMALGANADGYKLEKVWGINDVSFMTTSEVRQGFGMNGKFYINEKTEQQVLVVGENGLMNEGFASGANCGITRDEAGNILVSTATFPGAWGATAGIKVINPATGESVEYLVPQECGLIGRCDFLGFAKGNFFEDGVLYFTGGNYSATADPSTYTDGVCVFTVTNGEVNIDECYLATLDAATSQSSLVINFYKDINNEDALLYAYRSGAPSKLVAEGDGFTKTAIVLPGKGFSNGVFPFVWDGKELYLYPYKGNDATNYLDGWAIAEAGAEEPLVAVPSTYTAAANGFQNNWLNAEVDADGVTIYQYYPGGYLAVYRLTKETAPEPKNVYILGEVNDQQWAANAGTLMDYDAENNVYTATVTLDGRGESGENYFSFTTELAENNDDGGWAYIAPFRFGAVSENDYWYDDMYDGQPLGLTYENGQAFRVMNGEYKLTVSLEDMTLIIERVAAPLLGDVNEDGFVNVTDVTMLINAVVNDDYSNINFNNGDMNGDGVLTVTDVTMLINAAMSN